MLGVLAAWQRLLSIMAAAWPSSHHHITAIRALTLSAAQPQTSGEAPTVTGGAPPEGLPEIRDSGS